MKTMKKFILLVLVLLLLLPGCSLGEETVTVYCVSKITAKNADGSEEVFREFEYDKHGNLLDIKLSETPRTFTYDSRGNVLSCSFYTSNGAPGRKYLYTYDSKDNLIRFQSVDPAGSQQYAYVYTYDQDGNRISLHEYDEDNILESYYQVAYDEFGNRTQFVQYDQEGQETCRVIMTYDSENRLLKSEWSYGSYLYYTYDEKGNLLYEDGSGGTRPYRAVFTCDSQGNLLEQNKKFADGDSERKVCTYDERGNLLTSKTTRSTTQKETYYEWTYDKKGNLLTASLSDDAWLEYSYISFKAPASHAEKIKAAQARFMWALDNGSIRLGLIHPWYFANTYEDIAESNAFSY